MKILLVTLEYPPQKGGVASYYDGMVEELKLQGHEVEVLTEKLLGRLIWPHWLRGYFTARKALKKQQYDFVFVGQILPLGTVAYLLRKRVPYVVFTHGMDVLMAQKSWRKRKLARKILQHANLTVANSEFTKREVEKLISGGPSSVRTEDGPRRIVIVYPCPTISTDVQREDIEALRRRLGLVGKRVLLTLGRVVERKGHDLVIKALPEILRHVPNVVYVVAGDGPDLGRLQQIVARDFISRKGGTQGAALQTAVRFVGRIDDVELPAYYSLCDLFVMPARQIGPDVEGFGLSFLEAAQFGKASIGGHSGGQGEAILDGKTGVLVDPSDSSAFARTMVQLLRDDTIRQEMGQNAKARVVHEFTWEKQVENLLKGLRRHHEGNTE